MRYRYISYVLFSFAVYFVAIKYKHDYNYSDLKDYLELMSAVSGMVFTIMGIWVAFLYPNAISRITGSDKLVVKDFSESRSDAKRLESIVAAILTSAFVMIAALMVILAKIIFFSTPIYLEYRVEFKALALTAVILMTFSQLESVLKVVVSNVMFINDLHVLRQDRQADRDI